MMALSGMREMIAMTLIFDISRHILTVRHNRYLAELGLPPLP